MEILIGLAILGVVLYFAFKIFRGIFLTWKISIPVIFGVILIGILLSKGVLKTDDVGATFGIVILFAVCVISWACHARCPRCKTFTIKKVGDRHLSTSGVFMQKCGNEYHPHQKITGETIYQCSKCGFEKRSQWTKTERLDH